MLEVATRRASRKKTHLLGRGPVALCALAIAVGIAACDKPPPPPAVIRPVRTVVVDPEATANTFSVPGEIKARYESPIGFRISGKLLARKVDVGMVVKTGDTLAVLDDKDEQNALDSAQSSVAGARASVTSTSAQEARIRELLRNGFAPQARYDESLQNLQTAQASLRVAEANLRSAGDQLTYTVLKAPGDGIITAVGADAGQVVSAGQMVVQLANPSEREGLFNVAESWLRGPPRNPVVEVTLLGNPSVKTEGHVREIAPTADPVTRTYAVRVSLPDAPQAMRLGAPIQGQVTIQRAGAVTIVPATALFQKDERPAVWVVEPTTSAVQLQPVTVEAYNTGTVVVTDGLKKGDIVVTAGVQKLSPGQKVRLDSGS
jgi:RND family efflux transporter MFP subunit